VALPTLALVLLLRHADHELPLVAPPAPETTLDALYLPDCTRPGEFVGFSFLDPLPELSEAGAVVLLVNTGDVPVRFRAG
jgi:hypothetical protein